MKKNEIKKIKDVLKNSDWDIDIQSGYITFNTFSPCGQDLTIEIDTEDLNLQKLNDEMNDRYNNYDVSYETYLWLDSDGHGRNGAPYDMKDLYEDMEECHKKINELAELIGTCLA